METIESIGFTDDDFKSLRIALDLYSKAESQTNITEIILEAAGESRMPEHLLRQLKEAIGKKTEDLEKKRAEKAEKLIHLQYKLLQFKKYLAECRERYVPATPSEETPAETPVSPE